MTELKKEYDILSKINDELLNGNEELAEMLLNEKDGYYATFMDNKYVYKSIPALLLKHRKDLYKSYIDCSENNNALSIYEDSQELLDAGTYVSDTDMYHESRIMKALQYLTNDNIVRVWYDQLIDTGPAVESKVDSFLMEGN